MTGENYRAGLMAIAQCQADGQDVEDMVADLAEHIDLDPTSIQAEVDELLDS